PLFAVGTLPVHCPAPPGCPPARPSEPWDLQDRPSLRTPGPARSRSRSRSEAAGSRRRGARWPRILPARHPAWQAGNIAEPGRPAPSRLSEPPIRTADATRRFAIPPTRTGIRRIDRRGNGILWPRTRPALRLQLSQESAAPVPALVAYEFP